MNHFCRHSFVLLLCAWLASCATIGMPQANTFGKRVVIANSIVETTATTIETLFVAGKLTQTEAQRALDQTKTARVGIDIARTTYTADPAASSNRLNSIIAGLDALNQFLQSRQ